jgi:hypothetical protein
MVMMTRLSLLVMLAVSRSLLARIRVTNHPYGSAEFFSLV